MVKYVLGHKSPDTDSIVSAIMYSRLLNKLGKEAKAIKLGKINNETKFLLETTNFEIPETFETLASGSEIILVDHNERKQTIDNFEELNLVEIIDHHKVTLNTSSPLWIRTEIIGSTASIITKMFFEKNIDIEENEAKLLIGAILSDTLHYRSPTTTDSDKELVEALNEIAQIDDIEKFANDLFAAKSDLGNISAEDLIKLDYKNYEFGGETFGIGVVETTNPNYTLSRKSELIEKMMEIKKKDNLKGIIFSIIDILAGKNTNIYSDEFEKDLVTKVFDAKELEENVMDLGEIISRKKQMIPKLEVYFN